jgi:hypothetical protein
LGRIVTFGRDNTVSITMVSQGLDTGEAGAVWKPFLDWLSASAHDFDLPASTIIGSIPARSWWDGDFLKARLPGVVVNDERPGAPPGNFWWAANQNEVGAFWHGCQTAWLPDSLLEPEHADRLADALFAASRQWRVNLHFNKGLAGAPAEAVAAANDTATNPTVQRAFALAIIAALSARTPTLSPEQWMNCAKSLRTPDPMCRRATSLSQTGSIPSGATTIRGCSR